MMRSGIGQVVLAPPDTSGFLAAAALRRTLPRSAVAFLWPHEVSRRVAALADEADTSAIHVVDLVPVDSVQSLLAPSLLRLGERGVRAIWYYGRSEPAPALQMLGEIVDLRYQEGAGTWKLACDDRDPEFAAAAEAIDGVDDRAGASWRLLLRALTTSWDWARIYGSLEALAATRSPGEADLAWARAQLAEVERAESLVTGAEVDDVAGVPMAVVTDHTIPARVRPEIFRELRDDVDALAFLGGPGRLVLVLRRDGGSPAFLRVLSEDPSLTVGSLAGPRIDIAWRPGRVPESVTRLFGTARFEAADAEPPPTESARIAHPMDERIAKGLHSSRLEAGDRELLLDGIREHLRDAGSDE